MNDNENRLGGFESEEKQESVSQADEIFTPSFSFDFPKPPAYSDNEKKEGQPGHGFPGC